jgi:dTDP-4-dehydrorhamnose 3,5-epimerase
MELQEAKRDVATVTPRGQTLAQIPDGVTFYNLTAQIDERGSIRELYDPRWGWLPEPLVYVYSFSVRPGVVKGWAMHKLHQDRYYVLAGELEVVLYDERADSPTRGLVAQIVLSQYQPRLMNIPTGIWHADRNLGSVDAVGINFPTLPYDHNHPDKYRLPLDTDRIPHKFERTLGW